MKSVMEKQIYLKILEDENLKEKYFYNFMDRFVYSTADIEIGLTKDNRKIVINNLQKAFYKVIEHDDIMSVIDMQAIANIINEAQGYKDFRKINVSAGGKAKWTPVEPNQIYMSLYSLINNYYNIWSAIDNPYEREAMLHIYLMRIHPLEDGNKRFSKILLNGNLVKSGLPPVIIDEFDTDEYYNYINNIDIKGFTNFIMQKSRAELLLIIAMYKTENNISIDESIVEYFDLNIGVMKK